MNEQAIALCRVSTPEQKLSNSLNRQEENVIKAAVELCAEIPQDGWWSGDVSSKAGTNIKRKDLKEMLDYCKANKRVKYLLVDEVDRFMRSVDELFHFEVEFRMLGVKVWYASEPELNTDDLTAKLLKAVSVFRAEGSNLERQTKSVNGHVKAIMQGRYTFPPKPGYIKGLEAGIHIPHPKTHEHLKRAFKEVISGLYTPLEAMKRLNESSFNELHAPWGMDRFRHFAIDPYYAGILVKDKQVKARNEHGQHKAMLTLEEHEELVRIFTGTLKPRGPQKQYNPEFPMNKIMVCEDCGGGIKFTGSKKNSGYARKKTNYYFKYHCRGCGKGYHRNEVHSSITKRLSEINYIGNQRDEFVKALETVWRQRQQDKLQQAKSLQKQLERLQLTKSRLVIELSSTDEELKSDIRAEINNTKASISVLETDIQNLNEIDKDLVQFVDFGLNYTHDLIKDWWDLGHDDRVRCQQLVFPGGISFNAQKKVGTPNISPLYTLKPNKKDLSNTEKSLMVELPGTAPGSASLPMLDVYRLRSFNYCKTLK